MHSNLISNYFITEYKSLLRTTEQLFKNNELQSYLTNEQNLIMYELLNIEDYNQKLNYWKDLIHGKLELDLIIADGAPIANSNTENLIFKTESKHEAVDDEFIKMDLLNLQERLLSEGFVAALSLKVRYCLWEQPLKIWLENDFKDKKLLKIYDDFKNTSHIESANEENDDECYELLDDAKYVVKKLFLEQEVIVEESAIAGDQNLNTADIKIMKDNNANFSDDDYDMDDDDDIEKDTELAGSKNIGNLVGNSLKISISKETLSLLLTEKLSNDKKKMVARFNKIYHTVEDDKTTVLGKLQLEEAEKRMENKQRKRKRFDFEEEEDDDEDDDGYKEDEGGDDLKDSNIATKDFVEKNANKEVTNETSLNFISGLADINTKKKKKKLKTIDDSTESDLQISHLLSTIEANRSKLQLTDQELKKLLVDVQKTGSKWASDQKIGQEELYEACEKVLNQLRTYGSYCQPFMNKVSKREAPNYYDVIKQPMDLNTMLRKLRNIRYQSKQEFVEDLNLIWKNCLTYNTDTKLLIRRDCSLMQKKSASLIPSIPDITIRDRKEVEAELYEDEDEDIKKAGDNIDSSDLKVKGKTSSETVKREEKGKKLPRSGAGKNGSLVSVDANSEVTDMIATETTSNDGAVNEKANNIIITSLNTDLDEDFSKSAQIKDSDIAVYEATDKTIKSNIDATESKNDSIENLEKSSQNMNQKIEDFVGKEEEEDEDDMIDDEDDIQDTGYLQMLNAEQLAFIDDAELTTWKNMTSNARSDMLINRSQLFLGNKLNPSADALLRNNKKMKDDSQWLFDYNNELDLIQKKNIKNSSNQQNNGIAADDSIHDDDGNNHSSNSAEDLEDLKIGTDNLFFLSEYNVTSNLPSLSDNNITNKDLEKIENFIVKQNLPSIENKNDLSAQKSVFTKNIDAGMSGKMNINIQLIQEIRHICHKISLIRDLQNRQAALIASANNPNTKNAAAIKAKVFKPSIFRKLDVDAKVDLDFISNLPTRNAAADKNIIESIMFKINSRIAMDSGFEATERTAVSTLNEISIAYMDNLIKTIKLHQESTSTNKIHDEKELVEVSLLQNGILRPDMLFSYYEKNFLKKQKKLKEIKFKLNSFLKKLLRPSLKNLSERNFDDESSSYLTGDFSSEITGDDFFGFKELGLDKEFNMMNKSIPLHLLAVQMSDVTSGNGQKSIKLEDKELAIKFKDFTVGNLNSSSIVGLMQPCLNDQWELNQKVLNIKQEYIEKLPEQEKSKIIIKGDEELPLKLKAVRLATNGRISLMKKKNINDTIILPEKVLQKNEDNHKKKLGSESSTVSLEPTNYNESQLVLPTLPTVDKLDHGLIVPKKESA
ncbi:hypothetical protein QEN19_003746 [Hanseniaspora menglaensis]